MEHNEKKKQNNLIIDGLSAFTFTEEAIKHTRQGGISALKWTAIEPWQDKIRDAMTNLADLFLQVDKWKEDVMIALSVKDIKKAHSEGRFAIIMSTQDSGVIKEDLSLLRLFHKLGFRSLQPTYNGKNLLGYGASEPEDKGLTELGTQWVHEMNRLKMVIDLAHAGNKTAMDIIKASNDPVIVGHTNVYSLCNNPRNIRDEQIRAIADKGGVIGSTVWSPLVKKTAWPTVEDYLDHLEYIINLTGIDHASFASDMVDGRTSREQWIKSYKPKGHNHNPTIIGGLDWLSYDTRYPKGLENITCIPNIWDGLRKRGYSEDNVEKIMSGNLLRVFEEVWGE